MPARNTVQRSVIEAELRHLANHPTVDEVMIPILAGIEETASAASGYRVVSHTLQFDGYCPACQAKEQD